jgi:hypothetical protein
MCGICGVAWGQDGEAQLDELNRGGTTGRGPRLRALTAGELSRLAAGGVVAIGAHTDWHGQLSGLRPRAARAEVRDAGYPLGCTSVPQAASGRSDRLGLPRLGPGDWRADRFEGWLRRWLPRRTS